MADFDFSKLGQAGNIAAGIGGVGMSLFNSYNNVPKARGNKDYLKRAAAAGKYRYGMTDMEGLMSQWENTPVLVDPSAKDFYDPSSKELFGGLFGNSMSTYGATSNLTQGLRGMGVDEGLTIDVGSASKGSSTSSPAVSTGNNVNMEGLNDALSRGDKEAKWDEVEGAYNAMGVGQIARDLSGAASDDVSILPNISGSWMSPQYQGLQGFACGGHLHGCGGHKHACGGHKFDMGGWGGGVAEALNLGMAGLSLGLGYLGVKEQKRKAALEASEVAAANQYARQLQSHNFNQAVVDTKNNMFNQQALQMMAFGGDLHTHGADWPLKGNYNIIGAGGTHEDNPFGGVFQGMAADGKPNLVEEDEVIWNDYVFSNRIKIPKTFAQERKLKEDLTFAQAAQKLSREAEERPNDPISQNSLNEALGALMQTQEEVKAKREAARMKRQINQMSPDELAALGDILGQDEGQPFAFGGFLGHTFSGTEKGSSKMSKKQKAAAEAEAHGLFESGVKNLNPEWLKYIASKIAGYDQSKFNYTGADKDIRKFVLDNYDKVGGWEGLSKMFTEGTRMPLLTEPRGYKYTTTESYSMTPEQWKKFFDGMDAYQESLKKAATEGKYHADPNFTYNGRKVGKGLSTDQDVEQDPKYRAFKQYVRDQAIKYINGEDSDPEVLKYIQALDRNINTERGTQRLLEYDENGNVKLDENGRAIFRGGTDENGWLKDYDHRNYDQVGGIYHYYNDVPDITKTKTGERHIVRLNGEEIEISPEEMEKMKRFTRRGGDNYHTTVAGKDEEGNDVTTHYYDYESPELEAQYTPPTTPPKRTPLPTWMRYAPLAAGFIGQPEYDYSTGFSPRNANYVPIGDYLAYNPVDTQRYINANNQQANAQLNAIMNASSGNRNMAMAQAALANGQRIQGIGQILQAAEAMNFGRKAQVGEFNRGTNMFNAQAHNQAELANLQNNPLLLRQEQQNAMMRHLADSERDAAKSANLSTALQTLSDIGNENLAWNQAMDNDALAYKPIFDILHQGRDYYDAPTQQTVTKKVGEHTDAFGGYLLSNRKKNRR